MPESSVSRAFSATPVSVIGINNTDTQMTVGFFGVVTAGADFNYAVRGSLIALEGLPAMWTYRNE